MHFTKKKKKAALFEIGLLMNGMFALCTIQIHFDMASCNFLYETSLAYALCLAVPCLRIVYEILDLKYQTLFIYLFWNFLKECQMERFL